MEKKSWLWKRKSSERSPGETESSGSISSQSERYSDDQVEQESLKESMNHMQSPEVTSKVAITNGEIDDNVKSLTEKLSAALVNVGAKEDLVKQHAKVAEEAVAGWETAENEVAALKQQLEGAVQQNLALEVRVNHLDGALKECVKQLRQAREEQEQRIDEIIAEKTREWESTKHELQTKLLDLQAQSEANQLEHHPPIDPDVLLKLEALQKENSILRFELLSQSEELEIRTIERDLSTQAAETASKQQLESIKKVAKLEAECRRLQLVARKSPSVNDQKAVSVSSLYVDSLTDSQSDSGEKLNALEVDTLKTSRAEHNGSEQSCSDSWASALIAELDHFKNGKTMAKNVTSCEIDNIMDDFLEMERLASLPETQSKTEVGNLKTEDSSFKAELEASNCRVAELEGKLLILEAEKAKLENALSVTQDSLAACQDSLAASNAQLVETKSKLDDLQKELVVVNESKELLEFQLVSMEGEAKTMSTDVNMLKADVEKERNFSSEMTVKCQDLEKELMKKTEEVKLQQAGNTNGESKVKQEDLAVAAADRLSECQKTISSLARQLESLATLEDFLIDTANIPGLSGGGSSIPRTGGELWKLHSNDTSMSKSTGDPSKLAEENFGPSTNGNAEDSPASSSSSTSSAISLNHVGVPSKGKSSFGRLFSRSKSGIQVESYQG